MTASIWNPSSYITANKLAEIVSFGDYGAIGDGITDDTEAIQRTLDSSAKKIYGVPGKTYLVDGGLVSSLAGRKIILSGATLKLKDSASNSYILAVTGARTNIEGGEFDGNRENDNAPEDTYTSYCAGVFADNCTIQDVYVHSSHGIGLKGLGNYLTFKDNTISDVTHYGIYVDGAPGISHYGNKATGNNISLVDDSVIGQGILFTAYSGQYQYDYNISNNNVTGPSTGIIEDLAINLAVRGKNGIVSGNTTRYGSMGWSEGGDNCTIIGNNFLELKGTVRVGIEPSGTFVADGNIITDAYAGIDCTSATGNYDGSVIGSTNKITAVSGGSLSIGVRIQASGGTTAKRVSIGSSYIKANVCGIYLTGTIDGTIISNPVLYGPGTGSGRGVFLDTVTAAAKVTIKGGVFDSWQLPWAVYSATSRTFTDLKIDNATCISCGGGTTTWTAESSATIGARCSVLGANSGTLNVFDVAANVFDSRSSDFSSPENNVAAGVGSVYASLVSGNLYRKGSGTGNTGWVAM